MIETPAVLPAPTIVDQRSSHQSRRQFLTALPLPAMAARSRAAKPNILVILTDQQNSSMLSCAGNRWLKTPHMDSLARSGVRFERAYATNPVCSPSRVGLMTGRMPSAMGMECNEDGYKAVPEEVMQSAMGRTLRGAGYQTVYGGKVHLPGPKPVKNTLAAYGFEHLSSDERQELAKSCASFLKEKHERPFLLVASLINPHDICYMAIQAFAQANARNRPPELAGTAGADAQDPRRLPLRYLADALRTPEGVSEQEFLRRHCPPLPANLNVPKDELSAVIADKREFQKYVRNSWTDRDWRLHRWAYARLTEQVDREIGIILDGLRQGGRENDTLVILTSDHGDQDGSHRLEHKEVLYEESIRIPFIVSWKGVTRAGAVDRTHLVSNGLDLIPTLCDYAGVQKPSTLRGRSVRGLAEGGSASGWRTSLVIENHIQRLVHDGRWKYYAGRKSKHSAGSCGMCPSRIKDDWDGGPVREMLIDLENDPGEMTNLAAQRQHAAQLKRSRRMLVEWCRAHDVALDGEYVAG